MRKSGLMGFAFALCTAACGDEDQGEGAVKVTAYGESFIEDGIPADAMDDGWAVSFERFDVAISDVRVAGVAVSVEPTVDVSAPSSEQGHEIGSALVPEGNHGNGSFEIDRIEVVGSASKGGDTKTFAWVFDQGTAYGECDTVTSVSDGGEATFQITVHADHLFYDSLVSETPQLLFQAMADADTNDDGDVAQAELAAASIGAYDPGSEGDVEDLWGWLIAATRTVGHIDGEGHCEPSSVE